MDLNQLVLEVRLLGSPVMVAVVYSLEPVGEEVLSCLLVRLLEEQSFLAMKRNQNKHS